MCFCNINKNKREINIFLDNCLKFSKKLNNGGQETDPIINIMGFKTSLCVNAHPKFLGSLICL